MIATAQRKPLGQLLLEMNMLSSEQLERALEEQRRSNHQKLLGEILVELHICTEDQITEAQSSADTAAALSRDASATLDSLAAAMGITIFGSQPLAPLAVEFSTSSDQADQLADTLDSVSGSMSETRTDVAVIGVELDGLSDQLESLEITTDPAGGTPPLRLFIGLLLAWLAAQAIGAIVVGAVLLRTPRPVSVD